MLYRIIFYIIGLIITSIGLTCIIIYLSFINVGFSIFENISLTLKNPSTYLFFIGIIISLAALFYNSLKQNK